MVVNIILDNGYVIPMKFLKGYEHEKRVRETIDGFQACINEPLCSKVTLMDDEGKTVHIVISHIIGIEII